MEDRDQTTLFDDAPSDRASGQTTVVFTDGACKGNPGPGGWAWAVSPDGTPSASGGEAHTTNQRMELTAALQAIRALREITDGPIEVVSDSTYVVNCFRDGWWKSWQRNGWRNSKKQPVANSDLWRELVGQVQSAATGSAAGGSAGAGSGGVTFRWVKGHSGHPMNELVDQLAVAATPTHQARDV